MQSVALNKDLNEAVQEYSIQELGSIGASALYKIIIKPNIPDTNEKRMKMFMNQVR